MNIDNKRSAYNCVGDINEDSIPLTNIITNYFEKIIPFS